MQFILGNLCILPDIFTPAKGDVQSTAVQLVYNPFIQFVSQAKLYSHLELSLQGDAIALGVPTST